MSFARSSWPVTVSFVPAESSSEFRCLNGNSALSIAPSAFTFWAVCVRRRSDGMIRLGWLPHVRLMEQEGGIGRIVVVRVPGLPVFQRSHIYFTLIWKGLGASANTGGGGWWEKRKPTDLSDWEIPIPPVNAVG